MLSTSSAFTSLKAQVAAIGSPAVYIKAPNAPTVTVNRRMTESVGGGSTSITAAALPSPCTWTLTGRPTSSDPIQTNLISGITCTGYYFDVSGALTSADYGYIQQISGNVNVFFDALNCGGNAYINNVPAAAVANGFVFTLKPSGTMGGSDWSNPAYYWYVPAGETQQSGVQIYSSWSTYSQTCTNATSGPVTQNYVYAMQQNDPTVTGIPNAPIQGPITIN